MACQGTVTARRPRPTHTPSGAAVVTEPNEYRAIRTITMSITTKAANSANETASPSRSAQKTA
jgi:hypothetical protein